MVNLSNRNPIVFLDVVVHYGGSKQVTVNLARGIQQTNEVMVVDAYGNCKEYMAALSTSNIKTRVVNLHSLKGVIGGTNLFTRFCKILMAAPEFAAIIMRLRKLFKDSSPQVVVVNCEKALFWAKHSLPRKVPLIYYVMGEFAGPRWYTKRLWPTIDLVLGISKNCLEWFYSSRHPPRKTSVVHNGIDINRVINNSKEAVNDLPGIAKPFKLLFPASLIALKGQDVAIKAVAKLGDEKSQVQLWLSGSKPRGAGQEYPFLILKMISEFDLEDCVSFIGWRENILPVMAASDAVILTSKTEGMPCCLMQAMALQKPVIATNVGGIPELVRDGIDGFLVGSGDVDGTLSAMKRLTDVNLRRQMGLAAKQRIEQNFSLQTQANEFLEQIRALENT